MAHSLLIKIYPFFLIASSSHVFIVDYFHLRNQFFILLLLISIFVIKINFINFNGNILRPFIIITLPNIIYSLIYGNDRLLLSNIVIFVLVLSICTLGKEQLIQFIYSLNYLNAFFSIIGLFSLILFNIGIYKITTLYGENGEINILNFVTRFDSYIEIYSYLKIPRITSYLDQASLISAYMLLPLSLYLIVGGKKKLIYLPIIIFCCSSLGGSLYFSLLIIIVLFLYRENLSFKILLFLPIFTLILELIIGSRLFIRYLYAFINNINIVTFEFFSPRISSGISRLYILNNLYDVIISNLFSFNKINNNGKFGSLFFTFSIRSGILGLIGSVYLYLLLQFHTIKNIVNPNNLNIGFLLLYSCIFQSFVFNDYGFSSFIGLTFFALSLKVIYEF